MHLISSWWQSPAKNYSSPGAFLALSWSSFGVKSEMNNDSMVQRSKKGYRKGSNHRQGDTNSMDGEMMIRIREWRRIPRIWLLDWICIHKSSSGSHGLCLWNLDSTWMTVKVSRFWQSVFLSVSERSFSSPRMTACLPSLSLLGPCDS